MNTGNETTNAVIETQPTEPRASASAQGLIETAPTITANTASEEPLPNTVSSDNGSTPEMGGAGVPPAGLGVPPEPSNPLSNRAPTVKEGPPIHSPLPPVRRSPIIHFENSGIIIPGVIDLANESRFNAAFFSEPLTEYATGWRDTNNLEALLDFVAPPVQVGRRFEYKKADNAEAFLSDTDDARAIGADFKRVEYRGATTNDKTHNRGLTIRVDLDAVGDMSNWRELYTSRLLQRLLRSELRRAIDAIVGGATNANKTWDLSAGKDPDQDILTELIAAVDASGVRPNRILFGDVAWNKRLISHRAQATAGGFASAGLTPAQVASFLNVDGVRISRERYQSSTAAKSKVTPDVVLLFYGQDDVTGEDPTNTKRFWSQVEGGGRYRVYEQQVSAKMVDITVEHYSNVILTSSIGLRKLTIS